jgi:hypothetical protein
MDTDFEALGDLETRTKLAEECKEKGNEFFKCKGKD